MLPLDVMKGFQALLMAGGIFNAVMGAVFFSDRLLKEFLRLASRLELILFSQSPVLTFPEDPVHRMLIHGFGAAALILGATLIYSARDPKRMLPFILIDGLGRLLFGNLMLVYVFRYNLMKVILLFGVLELTFAVCYLYMSWKLMSRATPTRSLPL